MNNCDNCNYNNDDINNAEIDVCRECKKINPSIFTTKTNAINDYALTAKDLKDIRHNQYKKIFKTNLYLIQDIEHLAIEKHGSLEEALKLVNEKKDKKQNRLIKKEQVQNERKKELSNYLRKNNVKYREDSQLCEEYIKKGDKSGFTKEYIGEMLKEMDFFYNHTNYSCLLKSKRRDEIDEYREYGHYHRWTDEDEDDLREIVKKKALKEYLKTHDNTAISKIPQSLKDKYPQLFV
jgi:hypothetical protein